MITRSGDHFAGIVKWLNTADCKSALSEFGGSNPSPCTKLRKSTQWVGFFSLMKAQSRVERQTSMNSGRPKPEGLSC